MVIIVKWQRQTLSMLAAWSVKVKTNWIKIHTRICNLYNCKLTMLLPINLSLIAVLCRVTALCVLNSSFSFIFMIHQRMLQWRRLWRIIFWIVDTKHLESCYRVGLGVETNDLIVFIDIIILKSESKPFPGLACWCRQWVLAEIFPSWRGRLWSGLPPRADWHTPPASPSCSWGPAPTWARRCTAWPVWNVPVWRIEF